MRIFLIIFILISKIGFCQEQIDRNKLTFKNFIDEFKTMNHAYEIESFFMNPISKEKLDSIDHVLKIMRTIGLENLGFYSIKLDLESTGFEGRVFNSNIYKIEPYKDLFDVRVVFYKDKPKIEYMRIFDKRQKKKKVKHENKNINPPPPPFEHSSNNDV